MTKYRYRAYLNDGGIDAGLVDAPDRSEALKTLVAGGKSVFDLEEASGTAVAVKPSAGKVRAPLITLSRPRPESLFTELAVLMRAGMTVVQALAAVADGEPPGARKDLLERILGALTSGRQASEAFADAGVFRPDAVALISSGDAAGNLAEVFSLLAAEHEAREKQRAEIREAMAYPAFLVLMMIAAVTVITFVLVPSIAPVFEGADIETPPVVTLLVGLRSFLLDWGPVLAVAAGGLAIVLVISPGFRAGIGRSLGGIAGRLPLVGTIRRNLEIGRYLRSLSMMLRGGSSMASSLQLAARGCGNPRLRQRFEAVHEDVAHGQRLAQAIRDTGLFPAKVVSLVTAGDSVNRLPEVTASAADIIDSEARQRIKLLLSLMTPVMTILLGTMIGGLIVSIMTALLSINSAALPG